MQKEKSPIHRIEDCPRIFCRDQWTLSIFLFFRLLSATGRFQPRLKKEEKVRPEQFEPMCNPIAQAMLLNEQQTRFNIAIRYASDIISCFAAIPMPLSSR